MTGESADWGWAAVAAAEVVPVAVDWAVVVPGAGPAEGEGLVAVATWVLKRW